MQLDFHGEENERDSEVYVLPGREEYEQFLYPVNWTDTQKPLGGTRGVFSIDSVVGGNSQKIVVKPARPKNYHLSKFNKLGLNVEENLALADELFRKVRYDGESGIIRWEKPLGYVRLGNGQEAEIYEFESGEDCKSSLYELVHGIGGYAVQEMIEEAFTKGRTEEVHPKLFPDLVMINYIIQKPGERIRHALFANGDRSDLEEMLRAKELDFICDQLMAKNGFYDRDVGTDYKILRSGGQLKLFAYDSEFVERRSIPRNSEFLSVLWTN